MKRFLSVVSVVILIALLSFPGCQKWEGRYYIYSAAWETGYYQSTNESKFAVGVEVANQERVGVAAVFADWDFEIYDGDGELILKINRANYDTLEFLVTVWAETLIPDSSSLSFPGLLSVLTGREKDEWKVPGDIFNGKTPDKLKYTLKIADENGYTSFFSGELQAKHATD